MTGTPNHSRRRFITAAGATGIAALAGCNSSNDSQNEPADGNGGGSGSDGTTTGDSKSSELADKIVFYNAGSLEYDPGTAENIDRFEKETGIEVKPIAIGTGAGILLAIGIVHNRAMDLSVMPWAMSSVELASG